MELYYDMLFYEVSICIRRTLFCVMSLRTYWLFNKIQLCCATTIFCHIGEISLLKKILFQCVHYKVTQLKCSQSPIPSQFICYVTLSSMVFWMQDPCLHTIVKYIIQICSRTDERVPISVFQRVLSITSLSINCSNPGNYVSLLARKTIADS